MAQTKFKINDKVIVDDPDRLEHLQQGRVVAIDHEDEEIIVQFDDKHLAQFSGDFAGDNDIVLKK